MQRLLRALVLGAAFAAPIAQAQDAPPQSQILTLDQDRLFLGSAWGQAAIASIDAAAAELSAENRRIEAELTEEERVLTEKRATLPAEEFRAAADAFDAKVVEIRRTQDGKAREVTALRDEMRQKFFVAALPALQELMREHGAVVVLDARVALVASDTIDVTEALIARLDTVIGAGPPITSPKPSPAPEAPTTTP